MARRSKQSILKEINPECSLEGLMLKLQSFGRLMQRADSFEKAGDDRRQEEKGMTEDEVVGWHHRLDGHDFEQLWEPVEDREAWHAAVRGVTELNNSTAANTGKYFLQAVLCLFISLTVCVE